MEKRWGKINASKGAVLIGAFTAVPLFMSVGGVLAEDALRATFTIGERLRHISENGPFPSDDAGTSLVTSLGFGLAAETTSQTFSFGLDTDIPVGLGSGGGSIDSDTIFENPALRLSYALANQSSLLSFDASYRRADLNDSNFFDETADEDVVIGGGTRILRFFSTGLQLGQDGPVEADLNYSFLNSAYSDTTDPDLLESTTHSVDGRLSFRLTPVASVFVFADWREENEVGPTGVDRTTSSIGVGTNYDLSPRTSLRAQVSYDTDESDTNQNDGLGYSLGLTQEVSNGSYNVETSGTETVDGARHQVSVGRDLTLTRGTLGFSIGAVKTKGTDIEPLANVQLDYNLSPTSGLRILLSQSPGINDDDNSVIRTRLNINYDYQINTLSSLSAGFQLANDSVSGLTASDDRTISASLNYNRAVGAGWDMTGGIRFQRDQSTTRQDQDTRTVFVGLQKTFDFRP